MKRSLLLVLLLFSFSTFLFSQTIPIFKWMHQTPQGNTLRWVKMWDENNWYAAGAAGTFMKTTNGGQDWTINHKGGAPNDYFGTAEIRAGWFFNQSTGFVCGTQGNEGAILKTTDGGATFTAVAGVPTAPFFSSIMFVNNNVGFVSASTSGRFGKTTDGGATWTIYSSLPTLPTGTYNDIFALDENKVFIVSSVASAANVRYSIDGGANWSAASAGSSTINSVYFVDQNNGFCVGSSGAVYKSTDGGATWSAQATGAPSTTTFQDVLVKNGVVYVTGDAYDLYKSTDMGTTWTAVPFLAPVSEQPWTGTYYSTDFVNNKIVTVGTYGFINVSLNGGTNWSCLTKMHRPGSLNDIYGLSGTGKVWAVGAPGITGSTFDQISYSSNGGLNWALQSTISSYATFYGIKMLNANQGFVCGSRGAIYKTTNGGANWDSIAAGIANTITLNTIQFPTTSTGFTFGSSGNGFKTTDGGATWNVLSSGFGTSAINGSAAVNDQVVFICGASGKLFKSTDGGASFSPLTSGVTATLNDIQMLDANTGIVVGGSSFIGKTTDGGTSWTQLSLGTASSITLNCVQFVSSSVGYVAGASGFVGRTTDGGTTWDLLNNGGSLINGISAIHSDTLFTAGNGAQITKFNMLIVPVELTSLTSNVNGNDVNLTWLTATENNNSGFAIERSHNGEEFISVGFLPGAGTSLKQNKYEFIDKDLLVGKYIYRIKQIDLDGSYKYYTLKEEVTVGAPAEFTLLQNYPNPFNPSTIIKYSVAKACIVNLILFDALGREAAVVINELKEPGYYSTELNSKQYNLSSGVYFYRLTAGEFTSVKKLMLIK